MCSVISYLEVRSRDYLVASIECVHLPCDMVFAEVSSKDCLVASDKRVRLQCDIHLIEMKQFVFEGWFKTSLKEQKLGEKIS